MTPEERGKYEEWLAKWPKLEGSDEIGHREDCPFVGHGGSIYGGSICIPNLCMQNLEMLDQTGQLDWEDDEEECAKRNAEQRVYLGVDPGTKDIGIVVVSKDEGILETRPEPSTPDRAAVTRYAERTIRQDWYETVSASELAPVWETSFVIDGVRFMDDPRLPPGKVWADDGRGPVVINDPRTPKEKADEEDEGVA